MKLKYFFLMTMIILSSCSKDNEDEIPSITTEVIDECGQTNEFHLHPNHDTYQNILDAAIGDGFPGVSALVYTPENGLWQGTSGFSNVEDSTALAYCDVMYSGSVAKMYTVTAAMALYEDGYFELDDKISLFLSQRLIDSLPNAKEATIRQLMNHTAGMPDIDEDPAYEDAILRNDGLLSSAEEQLSFLFDDSPLFAPGESIEYSSTHTMALALILDKVLGYHHSIAITDKIISKLNLQQTFYQNETSFPSPDRKVEGYVIYENGQKENISKMAINYSTSVYGDAGVIASAYDYYQFLFNLVEGNIVSQQSYEQMISPEWLFENDLFGIGYGLGFIMSKSTNNISKIGHSGATVGGNSHVYYYPEKDSYLVLLTNTTILNQELQSVWSAGFPLPAQSIFGKFENLILN